MLLLFAGQMQDALAVTSCGPLFNGHRVCVDVNKTDFEAGDHIVVTGWVEVPCNRFPYSYCADPNTIYIRGDGNYDLGSGDSNYSTGRFTQYYIAGDSWYNFTHMGAHTVKIHTTFYADSPSISINIRPKTTVSTLSSSATTVKIGEQFNLNGLITGYLIKGEGSIKQLIDSTYYNFYTKPSDGSDALAINITLVATRPGAYVFATGFSPSDGNNFGSQSQNVTVTVLPGDTTTTLSISNSAPVVVGTPVTLVANLGGYGNIMSGMVNFYDGDVFLGSASVANKQASLTTSHIGNAGSHLLHAQYVGDANYNASSSANLPLEIAKAQAVTTLASSKNPVNAGNLLTFTSHVAGSAPTGSVSFFADGVAIVGCEAVPLQNGDATCSSNKLKAGTRQIAATYGGDVNNLGAQSSVLAQTIRNLAWLPGVLNLLLN